MRRDHDKPVYVGQPWHVVLRDVGLDSEAVLRRAGQPSRLFDGDGSWISVDDFYDLFDATEAEAGGPDVAIRAGAVVSAELFDPAYFAAICSPDLTTALTRLGEHMQLVGPFLLDVEATPVATTARYRCKHRPDVARALGLSQLAFMVALARRATRHEIAPRRVAVIGAVDDLVRGLSDCSRGTLVGCSARAAFEIRRDRPGHERHDVDAALLLLVPECLREGEDEPLGACVDAHARYWNESEDPRNVDQGVSLTGVREKST